jgi:hypothetical protein
MPNYNKNRYVKLLKEYKSFQEEKREPINGEMAYFSDLFVYSNMLTAHLEWESSYYYLDLLNQLMEEEICFGEFFTKFDEKNSTNIERCKTLESTLIFPSPHEKALGFADFLQEIMDYCESLTDEFDSLEESYELYDNNNDFRDSIEEIYLRLKKFLE